MENVSRAWTSDRQTFVLVLFLNHLSPWIWREALIGLPPCLRHVSFPPHVFARSAQGSSFPAKAFHVTISRFTYFIFLFLFFYSPMTRLRPLLARFVDQKQVLFYWLGLFSLEQICCQHRLGSSLGWVNVHEGRSAALSDMVASKVWAELSRWNRIRAISFGRGACTCEADFYLFIFSFIWFFSPICLSVVILISGI